jgi:hypothetical protein
MRVLIFLAVLALAVSLSRGLCLADDLDDNIAAKPATDDPISKDDEIGQADHNIKYIKTRIKAGGVSGVQTGKTGDGNMNSVVLGAGSNVRGDIIIIDDSRGNKNQIVGK